MAVGVVISPGLFGQQLPQLKREDVGRPFAASSPSGFKAARDYDIPNPALTEQLRQEARASVRAVFDFNPSASAELRQTLHEAFVQAQESLSRAGRDPKRDALPVLEAREQLEQRLGALSEDDFRALLAGRFAKESEAAALALVDRAYAVPLASARDELNQAGMGQGITLRHLGEERERVSAVGFPTLMDLREGREELDRFASVPGNLLSDAPTALKGALLRLVKRQLRANLTINSAETEFRRARAAQEVKPAVISIKRGQKVIGDGELLTQEHLSLLEGMRAQTDELDVFQLQLGAMALVALVVAAAYGFHRAAFRRFRPTRKDGLLLGLWLLMLLGALHLGASVADALHDRYGRLPLDAFYNALPVAAGAMLVRLLLNEELALFFGLVASLLAGMMLNHSVSYVIFALVGSLVGATRVGRAKDRGGIFRAGLYTGAVNALVLLALGLAEGKGFSRDLFWGAGLGLFGTAVGAPMVVTAVTPLVEMVFGYASDMKLLELANLNHPALKDLIVQSPGTYHHSIVVGSLAEGAAEAVSANPLLARCCAYYHDIGKGKNPAYFGENQKGDNLHDCLAPAMSAVIIKRHVTDGLELARQYKLPVAVRDVIAQHHGTRLVGFFFHKACREAEGKPDSSVDESQYRYAGPKPQFRESAIVMIADAVEASSRSMAEPTPVALQALVQKIINVVFSEGQLDECDLTLRDLNLIAQSFLHTLEGIYHHRPAYPPAAVGGIRPLAPAEPLVEAKRSASH
jgi:putative nucleotidyltransferase with HDIG domain